jgi:membrane protease YdiL (CAAX protease family)
VACSRPSLANHHSNVALTAFAVVAVAPIVEEVFFRGVIYRSFRQVSPVVPASVAAGTLFGLVHTNYSFAVQPELALFGVITALLYEYTGSLLPCIALHSFVNATDFELALTGHASTVLAVFSLLVAAILTYAFVRRLVSSRKACSSV